MLSHQDQTTQEWHKQVNEYEQSKKSLPWGHNPKPHFITTKIIKEKDSSFNPILQTYTDKEREMHNRTADSSKLVTQLAKNKDRALRYEQTYNIINLNDRLHGFESHPDYPTMKSDIKKKKIVSTNADYNILSNIALDQHNFLPPEQRPLIDHTVKSKPIVINANNYRDYDVISNKYKEKDTEKRILDTQCQKLQSAKNYWKMRNYDPVIGKYIDENKEKVFIEKRSQTAKEWGKDCSKKLPPSIQEQGLLYNPVNMKVLDEEGLKKADNKAKRKKQQYETRFKIEDHYRKQDIENQLKKEKNLENKINYDHYREMDNRGYNILSCKEKLNEYKAQIKMRNTDSEWNKVIKFAADKSDLTTKEIYKERYDYADVAEKAIKFKNNRIDELKKLQDISVDNTFKDTKKEDLGLTHKDRVDRGVNREFKAKMFKDNFVAKDKWFSENKNVEYRSSTADAKFRVKKPNERQSIFI